MNSTLGHPHHISWGLYVIASITVKGIRHSLKFKSILGPILIFISSSLFAENIPPLAPATPNIADFDRALERFKMYYSSGRAHSVMQGLMQERNNPESILIDCRRLADSQSKDGTWANINYLDQHPARWMLQDHYTNALILAVGALQAQAKSEERARHALASNLALDAWRINRYRNPNWWHNDFGAPIGLMTVGLLLGDNLSSENRAFLEALGKSRGHSKIYDQVGGGANQVWFLSRTMLNALLTRDPLWTRKSASALWMQLETTVTVPKERQAPANNALEGLQPDASFHQHGAQMMWANYAASYDVDLAAWAWIFDGTTLAIPPERLVGLRRHLLDGQNWVIWRDRMDFNGLGRRYRPMIMQRIYAMIQQSMADLAEVDPKTKPDVTGFLTRGKHGQVNELTGIRYFWRSDFGVFRAPNFYASVRMSSKHTVPYESINGENLQGHHTADGVTQLSTTGGEYDDIFPVWDWRRLPGTTNLAQPTLQPLLTGSSSPSVGDPTPSPIGAGGVEDGNSGCFAYQHRKNGVTARKAWFMDGSTMVCLGVGISSSTSSRSVITSVNQSLARGSVRVHSDHRDQDLAPGSLLAMESPKWIDHDGLRYEFSQPTRVVTGISPQTGKWDLVNKDRDNPTAEITRDVFSLLIDHGCKPASASYAYSVRPIGGEQDDFLVVENTPHLQAISWKNQRLAVVFWQAGSLTWKPGQTITVSAPCLLMLRDDRLWISDPTRTQSRIQVSVDNRTLTVDLPITPGEEGRAVSMIVKK